MAAERRRTGPGTGPGHAGPTEPRTGPRAAPRATARMASGLNVAPPAINASVPAADQHDLQRRGGALGLAPARQADHPSDDEGRGEQRRAIGRQPGAEAEPRATTGGIRDIVRPGHHAAAVAGAPPRGRFRPRSATRGRGARRCGSRAVAPCGGRSARPRIRGPRRGSPRRGRSRRSPPWSGVGASRVAPTAAIIPSCGSRRWAITAELSRRDEHDQEHHHRAHDERGHRRDEALGDAPLEATIRPVSPGGRKESTRESLELADHDDLVGLRERRWGHQSELVVELAGGSRRSPRLCAARRRARTWHRSRG